jgi:plastocyanin
VFVSQWGTEGSGDGEFDRPNGLAVASDGNVYVSDSVDRIQKFTSEGVYVSKWGTAGTGEGQFRQPNGVAVASDGSVYVADYGNNRIQNFTSDGVFVTKWGTEGAGDGEFQDPIGIEVASDGSVYVADANNHRIQKFNSDGMFVIRWGTEGSGDGEFIYPKGIAVAPDGSVYVSDQNNHRIQKFSIGTGANPLVAVDDSVNVEVGGRLSGVGVLSNDTHADGVSFHTDSVSGAYHGNVEIHPYGYVIYTHDGSATTEDSFTYTVKDFNPPVNAATATVSITIGSIPFATTRPVAVNDSGNVVVGGSVEIDVIANDPNPGTSLMITTVTQGDNGTVAITSQGIDTPGVVTYTHDGSATTEDSFTYTVSDGSGLAASAEVEIIIEAASAVRNVDFTFAPLESFTISAGTTVTWTNTGGMGHNLNGSGFASPMLGPNETFTHTFNSPGSFTYGCNISYHNIMTGVVTVD